MLRTNKLGVRFGGHTAVDAVSCRFSAGTLTAIVGPNGAGKTTFFNLVCGLVNPGEAEVSGEIFLNGHAIHGLSASARTRAGLGRAFQLTNLFPRLSVLENVRLALQARVNRRVQHLRLWQLWSDQTDGSGEPLNAQAHALLQTVALEDKQATPACVLPHGDQRKLEVALLMALDPLVYMFDEPTAGMSAADAPVVLDLIRMLKKDKSKTVLLVEHKMDVVRELADRIVVLHNGQLVADGAPQDVMASEVVQQAYLGAAAGVAQHV